MSAKPPPPTPEENARLYAQEIGANGISSPTAVKLWKAHKDIPEFARPARAANIQLRKHAGDVIGVKIR